MFSKIKRKLGITAGVIALLTLFVLGQSGPLLRMPAGSETQPGLAFFRDNIMGFYRDAAGDMGFGFESMSFEGVTADASETTLAVTDATADVTYQFRTDLADTYEVLATPDADRTAGFFMFPPYASGDALMNTTVTDDEMIVVTFYLPFHLQVDNVYARADFVADSGTDEKLGIALYENADAGTQLFEATSAEITVDGDLTFNVTDTALGPGWYRLGLCSGDISGVGFVASTIFDDEHWDVINLGGTSIMSSAANACTTGNPDTTTGALTDAETELPSFKMGS